MEQDKQIEELIRLLDQGAQSGVGHINVGCMDTDGSPADGASERSSSPSVEKGCVDCSRTPLACSVPTLHEGLDRDETD
jgi:hypothetical protein